MIIVMKSSAPPEEIDSVDDVPSTAGLYSFRIGQKQNRVAFAPELHALMQGRQKTTSPETVAGTGHTAGN